MVWIASPGDDAHVVRDRDWTAVQERVRGDASASKARVRSIKRVINLRAEIVIGGGNKGDRVSRENQPAAAAHQRFAQEVCVHEVNSVIKPFLLKINFGLIASRPKIIRIAVGGDDAG